LHEYKFFNELPQELQNTLPAIKDLEKRIKNFDEKKKQITEE